jgi:hypothetical protein
MTVLSTAAGVPTGRIIVSRQALGFTVTMRMRVAVIMRMFRLCHRMRWPLD